MAANSKPAGYILLAYFFVLLLFGLVILTSASSPVGYDRFGDSYFFIKRQLLFGMLPGLALFLICSKLNYHLWQMLAWPIFIITVIVLLLVFVPGLGVTLDTNAKSWIKLGHYTVQPAEAAKLGLVIFLSAFIVRKSEVLLQFSRGFLPLLLWSLLPVALILAQPDVGTAAILFVIVCGLLFIAGAKLSHLAVVALAGLAALTLMVAIAPYRAARLTVFLHPELDPQGVGYHINQAFLALGSGGFWGLGLGHSRQKFQYLPEVHADSIFAIVGEEMGFLFAFGLVVLLTLICYRGLIIAKGAPDQFGRLLVAGIIIWLVPQSLLNIGAMAGVLPITGVPLPFVSHGGTALAMAMGAVGIILNVSRQRRS